MATKNAINSDSPIEVAFGGTGRATLTDKGVLVGNGTSGIAATAAGTTGQILTGVTSAAPVFGTSNAGSFSFSSTTAGATRTLKVEHTDNTNTASHAVMRAEVGGTSGGDPYLQTGITGGVEPTVGVKNNASDVLRFCSATALGGNTNIEIATTGEMTKPLQSAFMAYLGSTDSNVTGNATLFTIGTGNALTEVFDLNADFNTNGTFTAPVTGKYIVGGSVVLGGIAASNACRFYIVTTARSYLLNHRSCNAIKDATNGYISIGGCLLVDMAAGNTCSFGVISYNEGANTIDVIGGASPVTYVYGFLAC